MLSLSNRLTVLKLLNQARQICTSGVSTAVKSHVC